MATPEGKIKKIVKECLEQRLHLLPIGSVVNDIALGFYWMPVPSGYGASYLDFIGHYRGYLFGIETKVPKDKPTPRQQIAIDLTNRTGAKAFIVRCANDLEQIVEWCRVVDRVMEWCRE